MRVAAARSTREPQVIFSWGPLRCLSGGRWLEGRGWSDPAQLRLMKRSFATEFKGAGRRRGQEEVWSQASRALPLLKWPPLFLPSLKGESCKKLAYAWKGEEENNCSNLQRICFNFCWKDSKASIVWTYGFWGEGSKFFQYGSFGILLIIRNKYGLNTRAAMKRDDFLVKLVVVCILVIIQQMDSTCCTSPSTYRWDWNISWIYILFGLTKPGFEFKGQWRN